jgi:hypothetical protein
MGHLTCTGFCLLGCARHCTQMTSLNVLCRIKNQSNQKSINKVTIVSISQQIIMYNDMPSAFIIQ